MCGCARELQRNALYFSFPFLAHRTDRRRDKDLCPALPSERGSLCILEATVFLLLPEIADMGHQLAKHTALQTVRSNVAGKSLHNRWLIEKRCRADTKLISSITSTLTCAHSCCILSNSLSSISPEMSIPFDLRALCSVMPPTFDAATPVKAALTKGPCRWLSLKPLASC